MGGVTQMIEVSAQTGAGLENLLEAVALQSEVMELKDNAERGGEGIVIEAKLDRLQGANVWITFAIREGKNREVKNILGALGLELDRCLRLSRRAADAGLDSACGFPELTSCDFSPS